MMIYLDTREKAMPQNHKERNLQPAVELLQFRDELRTSLKQRPDAIIALVDALCSNTNAKSVVELSLNPCFEHQFTSVYDAIMQSITSFRQARRIRSHNSAGKRKWN